jgi:hypothetical protein
MHVIYAGAPLSLPDEWFHEVVSGAAASMREEQMRTRQGFLNLPAWGDIPDPDTSSANPKADGATWAGPPARSSEQPQQLQQSLGDGVTDHLQVWRLLPALRNLPEAMLNQLSRSEIFQLNTAMMKESKVAQKLQTNARLTLNAQQLVANPVWVPAGADDRKSIHHKARFLGGTSCSAQSLWLQAREQLGLNGVLPIGNYDLDSVGCGGCVTPRGWQVLHDPSSSELRLKLFHMPNVSSNSLSGRKISLEDSGESISVGESLKEIADMEALRSALNTLREAMQSALPWNRSVSAICGFMNNTSFCTADLANNKQRAAILGEYIDYCLSRNALNWENKQPFLSTDELAHTWAAWRAKRSSFFVAAGQGQSKKKEEKKQRDDICRKYNTPQGCPKAAADCKTFYGQKLRHVCNQFMPGGKKCGLDHPRPEHK